MLKFSSNEVRVIGCLIEKSLTTPDQYPLSLNALTNACNQKSNREPVLSLSEIEVQEIVDSLSMKRVVMAQAGGSSRVAKYKHRFCNTEFSDLHFSEQELGILCVLFLRGPQTPGELRTRTNRLCQFEDVQETEKVLNKLASASDTPFVVKLAREPGKRESRYAHCFSEQSEAAADEYNSSIELDNGCKISTPQEDRILALEEKVELMQMEIDELNEKLSQLIN